MPDRKLLLALGAAGTAAGLAARQLRRRAASAGPPTGPGPDGRPGVAAITGASAGLGATFARHLAAQGYDLLLIARRGDRLEALAAELSGRYGVLAETMTADLTQPADVERAAAHLTELPDLALLVNNAGFGASGRFARAELDRQVEMIELHVVASVRLARAALPGMIARRRGGLINLASLGAFVPLPGNATYSATKAYLVIFSESLHAELAGTGVRVQALCPGFTVTEFHDNPELGRDPRAGTPGWMWMRADDVVAASLAGLACGGVVCIPGLMNQAIGVLARNMPTAALIRLGLVAWMSQQRGRRRNRHRPEPAGRPAA